MSARDILQAAAGNAGGGSGGWDLANAVYTGAYQSEFYTGAQDTLIEDIYFKPDGTVMYIVGSVNDSVYQYNLATAWDTTTASYVSSFSVNAQDTSPTAVYIKPDGTSMYIVGLTYDCVYQYSLSTAWDVTTASYTQNISVAAKALNPNAVIFSATGTYMYVIGNSVYINRYSLSTAWDISTAVYDQQISTSAYEASPRGLAFKDDGTSMFIVGTTSDAIVEYSLSSAWDLTTASYISQLSVAPKDTAPTGIAVSADGKSFYVVGLYDYVYRYIMPTAWSLMQNDHCFYVGTDEAAPTGLFFKPDGLALYIIGSSGDDVNQYTLSTAWDVSTASYLQNFSVVAQDGLTQDVAFSPDGLNMYVVGASRYVFQYTLSTAWDVSTANYLQSFSVLAQDTAPRGVFFKPDGLAMYVIGSTGDAVYQYTLTTAWDVSTASYLQSLSVSAQDTNPQGLFFKPDGLSMYVIAAVADEVNQYTLSTAWDVSTASYLQNFSVAAQDTLPQAVFFKPDGTMMFMIGSNSDAVWTYSL